MTAALGTAVAIVRGDRVLLGRRIAAHGGGLFQLPGGKPDPSETPGEAAIRETFEETGLVVGEPVELARQIDDFPEVGKRYTTIFFGVRYGGGEAVNREPEKCEGWDWYPLDALPAELFAIDAATVDAIATFARSAR